MQKAWVIEALESHADEPDYLVGTSKGRTYFYWSKDHTNAKKFGSSSEAAKWAEDYRLPCGYRICPFEWG